MLKYWIYTQSGRFIGTHTLSASGAKKLRNDGYKLSTKPVEGK